MPTLNESEKRLVQLVLQNEALRHYNAYLKKVKTLYHGNEFSPDGDLDLSHFYTELAAKIEKYWRRNNDDRITTHTQRFTCHRYRTGRHAL